MEVDRQMGDIVIACLLVALIVVPFLGAIWLWPKTPKDSNKKDTYP